jgi:hypothetical protein
MKTQRTAAPALFLVLLVIAIFPALGLIAELLTKLL